MSKWLRLMLTRLLQWLRMDTLVSFELNMATTVQSNDWWYEFGATIHVCNDKNLFIYCEIAREGQKLLMGNENTAAVPGKGSVEVHFTSGKRLLLTNVLHVPKIRKNLVSAALLCKKGLKAIIESEKLIFTKSGVFVGKGYYCNGMFKLCTNANAMNKMTIFYFVELSSFSLWHHRLGYVVFRYLNFMSKIGFIS
ncbi:UNVERIFIED_CONTAM: hypothetical protein Sradi_0873900 [Sesamum radiatum]|uniref:Retrovirus-related Pol polyprotein from transposon TNT 1-94-like beta-barrel domain-containing protein n=1 Tax=Sesamum radiatum TaxID=300843 RepID=A0AAW2V4V5_SESRA